MTYVRGADARPLPAMQTTRAPQAPELGDESAGLLERSTGLPTWAIVAGGLAVAGLWLLPKVEGGFHAARRIAKGDDRR